MDGGGAGDDAAAALRPSGRREARRRKKEGKAERKAGDWGVEAVGEARDWGEEGPLLVRPSRSRTDDVGSSPGRSADGGDCASSASTVAESGEGEGEGVEAVEGGRGEGGRERLGRGSALWTSSWTTTTPMLLEGSKVDGGSGERSGGLVGRSLGVVDSSARDGAREPLSTRKCDGSSSPITAGEMGDRAKNGGGRSAESTHGVATAHMTGEGCECSRVGREEREGDGKEAEASPRRSPSG